MIFLRSHGTPTEYVRAGPVPTPEVVAAVNSIVKVPAHGGHVIR